MDASTKKTDAFLKAIRARADAECRKIDAETENVRAIRLEEMEEEVQAHYRADTDYELRRIAAQTNREISQLQADARKSLADLRTTLFTEVFDAVIRKLAAYRETEAYKEKLLADGKRLLNALNCANPVFEIGFCDESYLQDLQKAVGKGSTIRCQKEIALGGIRAENPETKTLLDLTLDTALEAQKTWFLENAGLYVEE